MPSLYLCFMIFRADHSLQDVRSKLFPFKRKKINAEEVPSSISLPAKIKERSISSLVVDTPKVKPTGLTGRRTRAVARKAAAAAAAALRGLGPIAEDPVKKEIDSCDSHSHNSSLPANSSKAPQTRRQVNDMLLMIHICCFSCQLEQSSFEVMILHPELPNGAHLLEECT